MSRWLVAIDLQHVFADPDSYWATPRFAEVLPVTLALAERFEGRVLATRFVAPAEPTGAWVDYYRDWPDALTPADHPQYDLVPEVAALGPRVLTAPTFGKWGAELAALVGPDPELVVTGVSTDCCVLSTALAAADAGARVTVVADGCAGATDEDHARALTAMALYGPLITVVDHAALDADGRI
ncbi:nicotinamidase-related amidase [Friedmanniella endophytica]|uniref:Nicotinamidase-related amidase n=1 Tax=Microlunatus kandeliicorticis TaxID=1759536 RepID=A0A7W3IV15_9ACTN|nr:isochorismatase family protein [Microlunatus kandeliicorticis]MBA8795803.1 nicotinamidase-related amidase [Microlunatus kandeliicorticis]